MRAGDDKPADPEYQKTVAAIMAKPAGLAKNMTRSEVVAALDGLPTEKSPSGMDDRVLTKLIRHVVGRPNKVVKTDDPTSDSRHWIWDTKEGPIDVLVYDWPGGKYVILLFEE